ncbi:hypothetical protein HDU67_004684 [Dinochytrium kinnereticum]|nr:hypothetical protein HDU67_004684 [Dinochytrium kinnereticum]
MTDQRPHGEEGEAGEVVRYDRLSPFDPNVVVARGAETWTTAMLMGASAPKPVITEASASNPFTFLFSCTANSSLCDLANKAFVSAGARIGKSLKISQPVVVVANFYSFCSGFDGMSSCSNSTGSRQPLGRASPSAYFSARPKASPSKMYSFYPQALVKQLPVDASVTFSSADILAEFNSDYPFHYASAGKPIGPSDIDLEFVIVHELTHGMGYDTAWTDYSILGKGDPSLALPPSTRQFLAPAFFTQGVSTSSANVVNWQPLTAFDSFVIDSATRAYLSASAETIFKSYPSGSKSFPVLLKDFVQGVATNKAAVDAGANVYSAVTRGNSSLIFATANSANALQLNTPTSYQPGSSISHADFSTYFLTPDFLMIPAVGGWAGETLDGIIRNVSTGIAAGDLGTLSIGGVYGPATTAVLNTLGWALPDGSGIAAAPPTSLELNRQPASKVFSASPPVASIPSILLLFLLCAFVSLRSQYS